MSGKATIKSTLATSLVLVVVLAGLTLGERRWFRTDQDDDRTERITMSISFIPNLRPKSPVRIIISVDNVDLEKNILRESPWSRTITVPRDAQVSIQANQEIRGHLDCTMLVKNAVVDTNSRDDIGSVRCWHNRKH